MLELLEVQALTLLLIASLVGMVARRLKLPYTLALVVAGLFLGFVQLDPATGIELNADLLLMLLLPALLFEAAFHIELDDFRANLWPILTLAVPGVLIAVGATAVLTYLSLGATGLVDGFGWSHAFLFGSVIAATDPISVLALFKRLGVTRRLYLLVEGESLLNDGVAVVLFLIVTAVVGVGGLHGDSPALHGTTEILSYGVVTFVRMAVGGALVGAAIGGAVTVLTRALDDHLIETTLTTLVAYGAFMAAEALQCSGVISTVVGGIVMGSFGARYGMSAATKNAVEDFWEYAAFLANSFIFLLIGLELHIVELLRVSGAIVIAFAAVVFARLVVVHTGIPLANRFAEPIPMSWRHVMVWGGLRGSLSMVLILTLPVDFAGRGALVNLVFGVVALSLFVQGLSAASLLRRLGLLVGRRQAVEYERHRGEALVARRALEALSDLHRKGVIGSSAHGQLRDWYRGRLELAERRAAAAAGRDQVGEQLAEGLRRLADVERATLRSAAHASVITSDATSAIGQAIEHRLMGLEDAEQHGELALQAFFEALLAEARDEQVDPDAVSPPEDPTQAR